MCAVAGDPNAYIDRREPDQVKFWTSTQDAAKAQALIDAIPRCGLRLRTDLNSSDEQVISVGVQITLNDPTRAQQYRRLVKRATAAGIPISYEPRQWARTYPTRDAFEAALL